MKQKCMDRLITWICNIALLSSSLLCQWCKIPPAYKLHKRRFQTTLRQKFFTQCVVDTRNDLPPTIVVAETLNERLRDLCGLILERLFIHVMTTGNGLRLTEAWTSSPNYYTIIFWIMMESFQKILSETGSCKILLLNEFNQWSTLCQRKQNLIIILGISCCYTDCMMSSTREKQQENSFF